jgi:hypothetical protein
MKSGACMKWSKKQAGMHDVAISSRAARNYRATGEFNHTCFHVAKQARILQLNLEMPTVYFVTSPVCSTCKGESHTLIAICRLRAELNLKRTLLQMSNKFLSITFTAKGHGRVMDVDLQNDALMVSKTTTLKPKNLLDSSSSNSF